MALTREQLSRLYSILIGVGIFVIVLVAFLMMRGNRFLKYEHPQHHFKIVFPAGWEVMENYEGAAVVFRSKLDGDLDSFQEAVNVVVDKAPYTPIDLNAYTELAIRQMRAVFKVNLEILAQENVTLAGIPAQKFIYVIRFGYINIKYLSVWAVSGKTALQITYSAEDNQFDQHLARAEKMIKSLSFPRL